MTKARVWTGCVLAAGLALALGAATGAAAQSSSTASPARAAEPSAAPGEQARRRDRRRPAETAAATAAPSAAPTAAAADTAASGEPKQICKNIKPIGSRVARRICGTEEQWAADNARTSADAAESMRQVRDRSGVTGGASSGPASLGSPSFGQ
jgi:hypothetical protein